MPHWMDTIAKAAKSAPKKKGSLNGLSIIVMPNPNPMSNRPYGPPSVYTGAGANGIVEPSKPAAIDYAANPPAVWHEGETVATLPDGTRRVTPATGAGQAMQGVRVPGTEEQQMQLDREQKALGLPGYQSGGVYDLANNMINTVKQNAANTTKTVTETGVMGNMPNLSYGQNNPGFAVDTTQAGGTVGGEYKQPGAVDTSQLTRTTQGGAVTGGYSAVPTLEVPTVQPQQTTLTDNDKAMRIAAAWHQQNPGASSGDFTAYMQKTGYTQGANGQWSYTGQTQPVQAVAEQAPTIPGQVSTPPPVQTVSAPPPPPVVGTTPPTPPPVTVEDNAPVVPPETPPEGGVDYQNMIKDASEFMYGIMNGDNQQLNAMFNRLLQRHDAATASALTAQAQQIALDPNMTEAAKRTAIGRLMLERDTSRANLAGQLSDVAAGQMIEGAKWLYNAGSLERSYSDDEIQRMSADIATGATFEQMRGKYPNLTESDWKSMRTMYDQKVKAGEQALTMGDLAINNEQWSQLMTMVGDGADLATINSQLAAMGSPIRMTQAQLDAQRATTQYGMWKTQFDSNEDKYKTDENWRAYKEAVAAGDYNEAAIAYQKATGRALSTEQFRKDQQFVNESNDLRLQEMRNQLGDELFASVRSRIDSGLTYGTGPDGKHNYDVNGDGTPDISEADFNSMRDASPLGERDWGRRIDAAKYLLTLPGAANKEQAGKLLNEAFPGINVDFSQVISDENAQYMATVFGEMGDQIEAGVDWETIPQKIKDNWVKSSGLDEGELALMFSSMNVNAIDEAWKTISESYWYSALPPDQQDLTKAIFDAGLSGSLTMGWEDTGKFMVRGSDGSVIGTYDSEDAANAAAAGIDGATVKAERQISFRNVVTGETYGPTEEGGKVEMAGTTGYTLEDYNKLGTQQKWVAYRETFAEGAEAQTPPLSFKAWEDAEMPYDYDTQAANAADADAKYQAYVDSFKNATDADGNPVRSEPMTRSEWDKNGTPVDVNEQMSTEGAPTVTTGYTNSDLVTRLPSTTKGSVEYNSMINAAVDNVFDENGNVRRDEFEALLQSAGTPYGEDIAAKLASDERTDFWYEQDTGTVARNPGTLVKARVSDSVLGVTGSERAFVIIAPQASDLTGDALMPEYGAGVLAKDLATGRVYVLFRGLGDGESNDNEGLPLEYAIASSIRLRGTT